MKAAIINQYGNSDAIELTENFPISDPKEGQVLIEVHAASLNRVDSAIRSGYMQQMLPLTFPTILGGDFSGRVQKVGPNVGDIKIGDEVFGQASLLMGGLGSLTDTTVASVAKLARKPRSLDIKQAAALPLAGASALQAVEEHINIQPGQKILIHGGVGAIGSLAIQIAKNKGAFVATTVAGQDVELARSLGADLVIDYKTQSFTAIIQDYDAVLVTAADALAGSYSVLKKGGVLVSLAAPVDEVKAKENEVTAIMQFTRSDAKQLERLASLVDSGKIKPLIDKTFNLSEIKEAFNYFEQQHPKGKVVISVK